MLRISACVIVKDEERNLPQWLSAMSEIADEMIVVDTGSSDNTKALAEKAGARVFDFVWVDDFAAAKNYAIEKATGDWILFLDADEYFAETARGVVRQIILKKAKSRKTAVLLCRLINIDSDRNNRVIDAFLQARIFRRISSIRYSGRVHEQLINTSGQMDMVYTKELVIYHTGYSSSIMQKKAKRNLPMLLAQEAEAKDRREREKLIPYIADAYNALGEYEKAIEYARYGIAAEIRHLGLEGHFYEIIIGAMERLGYAHEKIYAVLSEARDRYPREAAFVIETGYFLWKDKKYLDAEKYLDLALNMRKELEKKLESGEVSADNSLRLLPALYEAKSDICYKKGDKESASVYYCKGVSVNKYYVPFTRGLYKCVKSQESVDIIKIFSNFYRRDADGEYLLSALSGELSPALAAYYGSCVDKGYQGQVFLQMGRFDSAAVVLARRVKRMNLLAAAAGRADGNNGDDKMEHFTYKALSRLMAPQYAYCCSNIGEKNKLPHNVQRLLSDITN